MQVDLDLTSSRGVVAVVVVVVMAEVAVMSGMMVGSNGAANPRFQRRMATM